jgi:hypothetical protein
MSSMTREQCLTQTLAEVVEHVKGLHKLLSRVMLDVAALRQTVLAEPSDLGVYSTKVEAGAQIAKPLLDTAMRSYDEIIQKLERLAARQSTDPESRTSSTALLQ